MGFLDDIVNALSSQQDKFGTPYTGHGWEQTEMSSNGPRAMPRHDKGGRVALNPYGDTSTEGRRKAYAGGLADLTMQKDGLDFPIEVSPEQQQALGQIPWKSTGATGDDESLAKRKLLASILADTYKGDVSGDQQQAADWLRNWMSQYDKFDQVYK